MCADPGSESSTRVTCRIARPVEFWNGDGMRRRQRSETNERMQARGRSAPAVPGAPVVAALLPERASDRVLIALPDVKATILRAANYLSRRCVRVVDEPAARELQ